MQPCLQQEVRTDERETALAVHAAEHERFVTAPVGSRRRNGFVPVKGAVAGLFEQQVHLIHHQVAKLKPPRNSA